MKWPIVGESGASNGRHQGVQIASENIVIILIYVSLLSMRKAHIGLVAIYNVYDVSCHWIFFNEIVSCDGI